MGEGAGYGIAGEIAANVACRTGKLCGPVNRVRKGQGLMVNMGASPHTPYYDNGIVRRGGVCGAHILCEHALSGKLACGGACKSGNFCGPFNRVQLTLEDSFYII